MGFFPPSRGRGRSWIDRVRGLAREEDLEDAVSHLSIYLNGLDHLYHEQAQHLKHQIDRAERAEQRIELEGGEHNNGGSCPSQHGARLP
jgi:hypothetical protein